MLTYVSSIFVYFIKKFLNRFEALHNIDLLIRGLGNRPITEFKLIPKFGQISHHRINLFDLGLNKTLQLVPELLLPLEYQRLYSPKLAHDLPIEPLPQLLILLPILQESRYSGLDLRQLVFAFGPKLDILLDDVGQGHL